MRAPEKDRRQAKETRLSSQPQFLDNGPVTLYILFFDIIEQTTTLAHQHQQAAAGMMILFVNLEVIRQIGDPVAQKADLHFRRSGVAVMLFEPFNEVFFVLCCQYHWFLLSFTGLPLRGSRLKKIL